MSSQEANLMENFMWYNIHDEFTTSVVNVEEPYLLWIKRSYDLISTIAGGEP